MRVPPAPHYLRTLAEFVCWTRLADIPEGVKTRSRWVIADCLPVIAAGMQAPEMHSFAERHLAHAASGSAWVIGTGRRTAPLDAALLNGTAGTWLELDEGNTYAKGHPGIQLVPAALAVAQAHGMSGEALLLAVILGYEASSRINRAARIRDVIHPHGTFGVVGAAVAVGHLLGFEVSKMITLLNVAASMAMATSYRTLSEGATVRNIYTGHSGYMGQIAAQLVDCGFSGERDGVGTLFEEIIGDEYDRDRVVADIGTAWVTADGYFKLHPTARSIQTAIDALENLLEALPPEGLDLKRVLKIEVITYKRAANKTQSVVTTSFGAKFSIPFAVATTLFHRRSSLESFSEAAVANPVIQDLALRVVVKENAAYTAVYPQQQRCDVTITLYDGTRMTGRCVMTKGEPGNPIREEDLSRKFCELGMPVWGASVTHELHDTFMKLESVDDLRSLSERFAL